mmetsp:Transcript_101915/g.202350  ORF Transcript_101915/g.202350 Transcript_101915/m.202350 type:complete len:201 (+) Transcript_101915:140-742(+)
MALGTLGLTMAEGLPVRALTLAGPTSPNGAEGGRRASANCTGVLGLVASTAQAAVISPIAFVPTALTLPRGAEASLPQRGRHIHRNRGSLGSSSRRSTNHWSSSSSSSSSSAAASIMRVMMVAGTGCYTPKDPQRGRHVRHCRTSKSTSVSTCSTALARAVTAGSAHIVLWRASWLPQQVLRCCLPDGLMLKNLVSSNWC